MFNIIINDVEVPEIQFAQLRVLPFKLIDKIHGRPENTARKRFNDNKQYFVENEDYFSLSASDFRTLIWEKFGFEPKSNSGTLITESGYLLLVKSFTDNLAWTIQKELVRGYFRSKVDPVEFKFSDWDKNRQRISAIAQQLPTIKDALSLKLLWGELQDRCAIAGIPAPDFKLVGKDYRQQSLPGFNVKTLDS
ncbi:ORF6N domain-containing protein [Methylobacter sp. S3L5C]|uniref:ORF6N domain-containing protein n=1 Tax=Methylobacter sp. S3L5C TaxID=2839024 RepID=UPI001FABD37F|nr:ORF6N domain-containing protein [Methylobacter sp. S3L5C]UOA08583.1 ORF6N domain-containing protein [Methylobacter sp. S3L5C]